ncbi:TetR/AcrR family transcriptional regulator [Corynebacterium aquilae]|uniref:HTH tetR-type domain-containing protein n=1 Tax=Corynebacterium aquilae DSM 44791 TaxID=1431546 RepID=A0A1L7CEN7_9CORY|nr:TetR/AcrR family transcriptional regulator [Corynebacterium aquilae]APT84311.1 hypothetical protein CAQU_03645 [Corynebacterium aquilae DSM 44791]
MGDVKQVERKAQILQAALALFAERGYYGTSMADIAASIDMRASSLYNHYSSKHELLATIMTHSQMDLLAAHGAALAGKATPTQQLAASMDCHLTFHAQRQQEVLVANREVKMLQDPERTMLTQLRRDYVSRWVNILERGNAAGEFTCEKPRLTAYALIDMGIGVAIWYRADGEYSLEEMIAHYQDMALRTVGA